MTEINGITSSEIQTRTKQINEDTSILNRSIMSTSATASVRNNIILDKVLANQNIIIENQNKIMQKLGIGEKLDIKG